MMGMNMSYMLMVMLPGMLLSGLASMMVKRTFAKYENVGTQRNMTGAEAAKLMLERQGVTDCKIEAVSGRLSDHYDPRVKTLRLSEPVYNARSVSAIGVACHEAGHALQHAQSYPWLKMRSALVPVTNLSSKMSMPVIMLGGLLLQFVPVFGMPVLLLGCALFAVAATFAVVTLPVEWDASKRAKTAMVDAGIVSQSEVGGAGNVLNAAFLTYLAAAITSIMTMLYYLHRAGVLQRVLGALLRR